MTAVLLAAVVYWIFGALWYSPLLFATPWMTLVGLDKDKMKSTTKIDMITAYSGTFLCAVFVAYGVDCFLREMAIISWADLIGLAMIAGIAFVSATHLPSYLFLKKPIKLFLIDSGYHFCGMILCFAVIFAARSMT